MDDASRIETAKRYLRRKYATDLLGLRALADSVAECATDAVTLTGQSFEGGSHSGAVTFEPMAYLTAIEDVLAELDDTVPPPPPDRAYARFAPTATVFPVPPTA
jgi:hypothetical protein